MMNSIEAQRQDRNALVAELKAAGAEIRGSAVKCPFHEDRHASGSIYQDEAGTWKYKCQASCCNFGGDVFDIKAKSGGQDVRVILKAEAAGNAPRRRVEKVYTIEDLRLAIAEEARQLGGQIEAEYPYDDPETGRVELLIFRVRTAEGKTFRQTHPVPGGWARTAAPKPWPLYNLGQVVNADLVIVAEGEKTADALIAAGFVATTSPAGAGKANYANWKPLSGKRVVLWPDHDDAGARHMQDVAAILERLTPAPKVATIPPDLLDLGPKEDAYDFIFQCRTAGVDVHQAILGAIAKARSHRISEGLKTRLAEIAAGLWTSVPWPWPWLSHYSRALLPQTVTIFCGSPGATKSFALLQALAYWFEAGIKIACFELEEDRDYHLRRALAQRAGNAELLNERWIQDNPQLASDAYEEHADFLDAFGRTIWQAPEKQATLPELAAWTEERAKEGCRIIAIDPVTAAAVPDRIWQADSEFITACKTIVRTFNASLILVSHPRKGTKGAVGLDDLAGGASYQRLSQTILWLEYHKREKEVEVRTDLGCCKANINRTLHLAKTRNGPGHGLSLGFTFSSDTLRLSEEGLVVTGSKR